jgi:triacylglycerol esterase/lipase EstA (alpha/beta hydrolase family)
MRIYLFIFLIFILPSASAQCDSTLRPVVFVHGFLASGDTWSNAVHYFRQAGYCENRLFAFDWNSIGGSNKKTEQQLMQFIDQILFTTGAKQIDLVGHSAGGSLARNYLKDSSPLRTHRQSQMAQRLFLVSEPTMPEYFFFRR